MMLKFGGHAMAAGLCWKRRNSNSFNNGLANWLLSAGPFAIARRSGVGRSVKSGRMTMEVAQLLRDAGPWGQMFRSRCLMVISVCCNSGWWASVFEGDGRTGRRRSAAGRDCFYVDTALWPDNGVREVQLAYKPISTSFAATAACKLSSTISGNLASSSL